MPRATNFKLNPDQEKKLLDYVSQRYETLKDENWLGRIKCDQEAWERYNLDVAKRGNTQGSIYPLSNLPLPVFAMVMEHFVSRCEDATTGDKPYFHFQAVGISGEQKKQLYNSYFNWKLDEMGKVHEALTEAKLPAFIQKAQIQKACYDKVETWWIDTEKDILHDKATGQPIEIAGHGPIIKDEDQFVEQLDPIQSIGNTVRGMVGMEQKQATRQHLGVDPSFVLDPDKHEYRRSDTGLRRSEVLYAGPKSVNVPYDCFLCPMDAESEQSADIIIELENKYFDWFKDNWIEREWCKWADYEGQLKQPTAVTNPGADTKSAKEQEIQSKGNDQLNPRRRVWCCWVRRDILTDGTGQPQEFCVYVDAELKVAIYYEWQAKLCPDLKRPYTVTAIGKVPNRWYGKSLWERGKPIFESVDRLFNGEYFRTLQQANPPKGGDTAAAVEEPSDVPYDPQKFWQLKKGRKIEELFSVATIPDTNQRTQMVMEYIIFWIQLWLGISNLAQGDYAAVRANATKYGIEKTLQEASMLGRRFIRKVINSDEDQLTKLVQIALATLPENQMETFEFMDGDERKMAELMTTEIRKLHIHVTIVMSQEQAEKDITRAQAALAAQQQYFSMLDPGVREAMRPLILEVLTDLGYKDVEKLLPPFAGIPISAKMGGAPGAGGAAPGAENAAQPPPEVTGGGDNVVPMQAPATA